MPVNFSQLDYWMVRGFSGILSIVRERLTKVPIGFCSKVRQLMASYTMMMSELNEGVQCREEEKSSDTKSSLTTIDEWFTRGFSAIDRYLDERSRECEVPMSEACLHSIEEHIDSLKFIIARERSKCQPSNGSTES